MYHFTPPVDKLIAELKKIPGIGQKSAQRICYFLLKTQKQKAMNLAQAIIDAREKIFLCSICNDITSVEPCEICSAHNREEGKICVVEEPFNIYTIEKTNLFRGRYHVLHGNLSPIRGIGPDELKVSGLIQKLKAGEIKEVILALSPTTEGNATVHYLTDIIRSYKITVTRIAVGLPIGSDIDYVDSITMAKAIESRTKV